MDNYIRTTVESLWRETVDSRFSDEEFISNVLLDCGHDASGITQADFLELLNTGTCAVMEDIAWSCNEVLGFYTTHDLGAAELVRAIFIALVAVKAVNEGFGSWDFLFDKICVLLTQNMDKLDFRFRTDFLKRILCSPS